MKIQLQRMHKEFGREHVHKCGECCNFVSGRYEGIGRVLQKCKRYGLTHSEATDWAQKWPACTKFNVPLAPEERPLMAYVSRKRQPEGEIPGQMMMEAEE